MKKRFRTYFRLNLMSIVLVAISFISVTLAWFAYSGLAGVGMEVDVKAWYIELEQDGKPVSNEITISLDEIYPGMDVYHEEVTIRNIGDSNAQIKYSIVSARILDENNYEITDSGSTSSEYVEDLLAHNFPFDINISLTKNYAKSGGDESTFEVSVSWPLDSGNNELDSLWGNKAYEFQKKAENKDKPSIQVIISVIAEQYIENSVASDIRYNLGDVINIDVVNNTRCDSIILPNCMQTYVLDVNNTLGDNTVKLLVNPLGNYPDGTYDDYPDLFDDMTLGWTVDKRALLVKDLINVISKDVKDSFLVRENISDAIIGNLNYLDRVDRELTKAISANGYYRFSKRFEFLTSLDCYWLQSEYNISKSFALRKLEDDQGMLYGNDKTSSCKVVPVIEMEKTLLEQ